MDFPDCKSLYSPEKIFNILLENETHKDIIKREPRTRCIARTQGEDYPYGITKMECPRCKNKSNNGYFCKIHSNDYQYKKLGIDGGIPTPDCYKLRSRFNTHKDYFDSLNPEEKIKFLRSLPNKY